MRGARVRGPPSRGEAAASRVCRPVKLLPRAAGGLKHGLGGGYGCVGERPVRSDPAGQRAAVGRRPGEPTEAMRMSVSVAVPLERLEAVEVMVRIVLLLRV